MPPKRSSPGVPLPRLWQLLLLASAVCAGWLVWSHRESLVPGSRVTQSQATDQLAAALEHLHEVELIARSDPDALPRLIDDLTNGNPRMRRNVLLVLQRLGPGAEEALDLVRECLADADPATRRTAIDAYWHIRRDPDDVALVASALLGDEDSEVRLVAAKVLETIGPTAAAPVTELLSGHNERALVPGLQLLRRINWDDSQTQTGDVVRRLVGDPNADVRFEALVTLVTCGSPSSAEIRELLQAKPSTQRMRNGPRQFADSQMAALEAIARLGPAAAENLPDVLALLTELRDSYWLAHTVMAVLRSMKSAALPAVPRLFELFDESRNDDRFVFARALVDIGADSDEIFRIVSPFLTDRNEGTCFTAGRVCARASPAGARRQVSALIPRLSDEDLAIVHSAVTAIRGMAPEAEAAVPELSRLLEHADHRIFHATVMALGDIGPPAAPAVPALRSLLAGNSPRRTLAERPVIFSTLGRIGPAARSTLPELLAELNAARFLRSPPGPRGFPESRPDLSVIRAVVSIGGNDSEVRGALRRLLSSDIAEVRLVALQALLEFSPESPDILDDFMKCFSDAKEKDLLTAILAVGLLNGDRREAVPILTEALRNSDPMFRKAAAWALGTMGPDAGAALPALHESLADWKNSFFAPRPMTQSLVYGDPWANEAWREQTGSFRRMGETARYRLIPMSVHQVVREAIAAIEPPVSP
jgi:HEAT repeat protein